MMDELEVIWDGSHNERDDDLLSAFTERIPEKRVGTAVVRNTCTGTVERVLRAHSPLTMRQIAAVAGVGLNTANTGLYQLRRHGRLGSREVADAPRTNGRALKEYWLIDNGPQ